MDDCRDARYRLVDSSSYTLCSNSLSEGQDGRKDANYSGRHPWEKTIQKRTNAEIFVYTSQQVSANRNSSPFSKPLSAEVNNTRSASIKPPCNELCHHTWESILKLKESTKKLLCLIEDIQSKTYSKDFPSPEPSKSEFKHAQSITGVRSPSDLVVAPVLKQLEDHTKTLNPIIIENEDDDCSIFKRLTGKCICLNQQEYNDFVIHFNEETKFYTTTSGELIKNMRILKKFLYMGGKYTKNALVFLNEGLEDSSHTEKVEITQGCSHSDMCNVFEDNSLVIMCISWPCKFEYFGDNTTQNLAASFLYKLALLEEGRRYLKYTSKITTDIKKILKKRASKLDMATAEFLNSALDLIHPPLTQLQYVTYYSRPVDEGYAKEITKALIQYREYMTSEEIHTHLNLLQNLSNEAGSKTDMTPLLPALLKVFKQIVKEYDSIEINILITSILNNIVSVNMLKQKEPHLPKTMTFADIATEPIKMKNEIIQMPPQKKRTKKASNKSKSHVHVISNKYRQMSRRKVSESENKVEKEGREENPPNSMQYMNRSKKFL